MTSTYTKDKTMEGTIREFVSGCSIVFESGTYWFVDEYDNSWYAAKWNNRWKLFDIFNDLEFLTYEEGCQLIQNHFKRKLVTFKKTYVSGFGIL